MKNLLAEYNRFEARNNHSAAAALLVDNFGTEEEKEIMLEILKRHSTQGYISMEDYRKRFEISNKYYALISKPQGS